MYIHKKIYTIGNVEVEKHVEREKHFYIRSHSRRYIQEMRIRHGYQTVAGFNQTSSVTTLGSEGHHFPSRYINNYSSNSLRSVPVLFQWGIFMFQCFYSIEIFSSRRLLVKEGEEDLQPGGLMSLKRKWALW